MQTFLPYPDFAAAAASLDRQRLGKQRVENLQILQTLLHCHVEAKDASGKDLPREQWRVLPNGKPGWANHPAIKMWRGHELALLFYQQAMVDEWVSRGYNDTCMAKSAMVYHFNGHAYGKGWPPWLGDEEFHISHQSNLIRKDPAYYEPQFPGVPGDLEYVWPI